MQSRHKVLAARVAGVMACSSWFVLPDSLKTAVRDDHRSVGRPGERAGIRHGPDRRVDQRRRACSADSRFPAAALAPGGRPPARRSSRTTSTARSWAKWALIGILTFGGLVIALARHLRKLKRLTNPIDRAGPGREPVTPWPGRWARRYSSCCSWGFSAITCTATTGPGTAPSRPSPWASARIGFAAAPSHPTDDEATHGWDYSISPAAV